MCINILILHLTALLKCFRHFAFPFKDLFHLKNVGDISVFTFLLVMEHAACMPVLRLVKRSAEVQLHKGCFLLGCTHTFFSRGARDPFHACSYE